MFSLRSLQSRALQTLSPPRLYSPLFICSPGSSDFFFAERLLRRQDAVLHLIVLSRWKSTHPLPISKEALDKIHPHFFLHWRWTAAADRFLKSCHHNELCHFWRPQWPLMVGSSTNSMQHTHTHTECWKIPFKKSHFLQDWEWSKVKKWSYFRGKNER